MNRDMNESSVLYGRHAVLEALKSETTLEKIFLLQSRHPADSLHQIRRSAEESGIPVLFAPKEKLDRLAQSRDHQGVVALVSTHEYATLQDILERKSEKRLILVLDHLEDTQNLGSLLRTADAVGASGVVIPKRRAAGLSGGAAKASAGAIHHIPVARVVNIHQTLLELRKADYTLVGADQSAEKTFQSIHYPEPLAVVVGNEHKGLSLLVKNTCDTLVKIPMIGHLDSLNVSVAGALILYQAFLQWEEAG